MANILDNITSNNEKLNLLRTKIINYIPDIDAPNSALDTSDATATNSVILSGYTAYSKGEKITGSILTKNTTDISVNNEKILIPAGYYASNIEKSVILADQSIPVIKISNSGVVTATSTQNKGYVAGGTTTTTTQLPVQSEKIITPSEVLQTAVSMGVYTTGAVTVGPIPDNYLEETSLDEKFAIETDLINQISLLLDSKSAVTGTNTDDATAVAGDILKGKTAYSKGQKITGTIETRAVGNLTVSGAIVTVPAGYYASNVSKSVSTIDRANTTITTTADSTNAKLTLTASNNQSTGYVTGSNKTASKTITLTANGASVTASDGSTSVSKSVATATQATPSVTISSSGLITASATQTAGYVAAGTKSGTKQLTTKAATTITPTTSTQTAVNKNVYTTGVISVGPIPSNYEDITSETTEYTSLINQLETAITSLEETVDSKLSST